MQFAQIFEKKKTVYLNLVAKRNHFIAYSVRKSSKSLLQKHRKITYIYIQYIF